MTMAEARERLNNDFGDMVSVHKAFQMLGKRDKITPAVSSHNQMTWNNRFATLYRTINAWQPSSPRSCSLLRARPSAMAARDPVCKWMMVCLIVVLWIQIQDTVDNRQSAPALITRGFRCMAKRQRLIRWSLTWMNPSRSSRLISLRGHSLDLPSRMTQQWHPRLVRPDPYAHLLSWIWPRSLLSKWLQMKGPPLTTP